MNTNLNDTIPAAPTGRANVMWQKDGSGNVSASVLPTGTSGALILLEQHTASNSASLDFTTRNMTGSGATFQGDFDTYMIVVVNLIPATNTVSPTILLSTNGGSTWDTSAIYDRQQNYAFGTTVGGDALTNQTSWVLAANVSNDSHYGVNGEWFLSNPASASLYKGLAGSFQNFDSSAGNITNRTSAWYKNATVVNAIRILFSSGNIASGTVRVYGVANTSNSPIVIATGLTTQTNYTSGGRTVGTVYQNTSSKSLMVWATVNSNASTFAALYSSSVNPPTDSIFSTGIGAATNGLTVVGLVLPGYYYKITVGAGTPGIYDWYEQTDNSTNTLLTLSKGDLISYDTQVTKLPVGTDGQVLVADSTQAKGIKWASSGGLVLLGTYTASSSAELDIVSRNASGQSGAIFQSDYDEYQMEINYLIPATSTVYLYYQVSSNGGSSYDSSTKYQTSLFSHYNNSTSPFVTNYNVVAQGVLSDQTDSNANWGNCGTLKLRGMLSTSKVFLILGETFRIDTGGNQVKMSVMADYTALASVNAMRLYYSSGNIASGTVRVYGLAK